MSDKNYVYVDLVFPQSDVKEKNTAVNVRMF